MQAQIKTLSMFAMFAGIVKTVLSMLWLCCLISILWNFLTSDLTMGAIIGQFVADVLTPIMGVL